MPEREVCPGRVAVNPLLKLDDLGQTRVCRHTVLVGNRSNVGLLLALDYLVDVPRALFTERRRSSQDHKAARRWGAG